MGVFIRELLDAGLLHEDLDTEADDKQMATLQRLTERYCVVHQTLSHAPDLSIGCERI